jgi:hypothetical protein
MSKRRLQCFQVQHILAQQDYLDYNNCMQCGTVCGADSRHRICVQMQKKIVVR